MIDVTRWRQPPHLVFANLRRFDLVASEAQALLQNSYRPALRRDAAGKLHPELIDLKASEEFVRKYGVLFGPMDTGRFDEDVARLTNAQDKLRRAWAGDSNEVGLIELDMRYALEAQFSVNAKSLELMTDGLWSLICVLFLIDHATGKTGVCGNPQCPAAYFLRKRKDQKYCERGPCSAYAQRKYALGWWERKGYELRARNSKRSKRRK
jgi:hypothetical protein